MKSILNWLKQPSSVAGLATLFGTLSALLLHQMTPAQGLSVIVGSVVSILLPDNSVPAAKSGAVNNSNSSKKG